MSQAEGGQRCQTHTRTAWVVAESQNARYANTVDQPGTPPTPGLAAKKFTAAFNLADARAKYASTPAGITELTRLSHQTPANNLHTNPNAGFIAEAITKGSWLRARATEVRHDVRNGHLTGEQARDLVQFPSYTVMEGRQQTLDRITAKEKAQTERFALQI